MDPQQIINVLSSQLDEDGVTALNYLVEKVASESAQAAAEHEDGLAKLAGDLAEAGFEPQDVEEFLNKLAEEQKLAQEVQDISNDCQAMGTVMGKFAFDAFMALCSDHVQKTAEEEEKEKEEEEDKEEEKKDKEEAQPEEGREEADKEEPTKEAHIARLAEILAPFIISNQG